MEPNDAEGPVSLSLLKHLGRSIREVLNSPDAEGVAKVHPLSDDWRPPKLGATQARIGRKTFIVQPNTTYHVDYGPGAL